MTDHPPAEHREESRRAVVLLSGGLDSATAAAMARAQGYRLYALSIDYGQRHRFELPSARQVAKAGSVLELCCTLVQQPRDFPRFIR